MGNQDRHKRRTRERDDLTGERAFTDIGQVILACFFMAIWISDTFFLRYSTFLNQYVPLWLRISLAVIVLLISAYLARTGLSIVFGEVREEPCVIRKGVFNWVRHPIYLSEILLYFGLLLMSLSIAAAVVWGIAWVFFHHVSRYEEKLLLERFGDDYETYMQEVPMWIPRLRRG